MVIKKGLSKAGSFCMIRVDKLVIPEEEYQRKQVTGRKVKKIADSFDWACFGCLTVVRREDGSLMVVDGGHRLRGARLRGDVDRVPCMVFNIQDISEEARLFLNINESQTKTSAEQHFVAGRIAQNPAALIAADILASKGFEVQPNKGRITGEFSAIGTLMNFVDKSPDDARRVFDISVSICDGKAPTAHILRGVWYIAVVKSTDLDRVAISKLRELGAKVIHRQIAQSQALLGTSGEKAYAHAILTLANKNRRARRIVLPA